ncbi:MAG: 2-oxoacid:acceptor oxidoreductase subunit alpha [Candidatus Omnitrophota bacterium]
MFPELTLKISGEAGQGMQTVGFNLCRLLKRAGFFIFANHDYMSRVRGGNNFFQLRVSQKPLYALREKSDIIVVLDKQSLAIHGGSLSKEGLLVADSKKFNIAKEDSFFDLPMNEIAGSLGNELFVNSVVYGFISGVLNLLDGDMFDVIKEDFSGKAEAIISKNIMAAKSGYEFAKVNFKSEKFFLAKQSAGQTLLMNGNEAIALGAIRAGCKFYSAYPMTPSTSIMNEVAHRAKDFNIVVEQAEDEIAAINMAIGASYAGARAMTSTSGGGFCLMVEGVSLSAMTETPVVIVDAQRPAPATGFPTRTEQSDLSFLLSAGHGEFARAILAPGTIEEAFYLTVHAFNLAEKYQIPVLIMTDQHLADSYRNVATLDQNSIKVERFILSKEMSEKVDNYKRYELSDSGISPRAIPSWIKDVIYVDSDEHAEEGHITEDAVMRTRMVEKRLHKKMQGLISEVVEPKAYNVEQAEVVLIGFGSTYGVLKEVSDMSSGKIGFIHLPQVWPFPTRKLINLLNEKVKVITVENNASGQLAKLIHSETGIKIEKSILKFDGRPFNVDYLIEQLKTV